MNDKSDGEIFVTLPEEEQQYFVDRMGGQGRRKFFFDWNFWARPEQLAPLGDWSVWLLMAGRGFGKTRAGAEWVRKIAENEKAARFALVGANYAEVRSVMIEGESGLLSIAPDRQRPDWEPSLKRLRWASGAEAYLYSAAEPEALRGPQHSHAWCDEIAKWANGAGQALAAWDNLKLGLRLGLEPQIVATTTPRPVPLVRRLWSGKNLAAIGAEIIQFGSAVPLGNNRFRIADLLRGLGGTEHETGSHVAGEDFLLLDAGALQQIEPARIQPFQPLEIRASGRDDVEPVLAAISAPGRALVPWSPVHASAIWDGNGDLIIGWTRRSRAVSNWPDFVEVPLAEETEIYRIAIAPDLGGAVPILEEISVPFHQIPYTTIEDYRAAGATLLTAEIRQIGSHSQSIPLVFDIPLQP